MNILLINHYAGSCEHGMEYRPFYLAREWVRLGHKVTIVAASYSHLRSQSPNITGNINESTIEGIHYIWLKTPKYHGNGIGRVWNIFTFVLKLFLFKAKIISGFYPDVVIASSTYPLDIYPAFFIARKMRAKLVFEVHDLWPLSPIELGGMSPRHPFIIIMQWAENYAYKVSDIVVSLLPKADKHMVQHGMSPEKFIYIPNGINIEEWLSNKDIIPDQHFKEISNLKHKNQFIIGYAGSHGISNALIYLIEAAALLDGKPIAFLLVGQGPGKKALQKKASMLGLSNVIFLPPVPKTSIPSLLSMMDVLYIGWNKKPIYRFGICPNKLLDYMMASKPIIHSIEAGNDLVVESGCGISVPPEEPQAIVEAIHKLMKMSAVERDEMGLKGRKYIEAVHDYKQLAQKFIDVMRK